MLIFEVETCGDFLLLECKLCVFDRLKISLLLVNRCDWWLCCTRICVNKISRVCLRKCSFAVVLWYDVLKFRDEISLRRVDCNTPKFRELCV